MKCNRPLYFVLTECHLMDDNGQLLVQEDLLKIWELYNLMVGSTLSTFILRGESNENLISQFGADANDPVLLAKYLFMAGEKGRICWSEKEYLDPDDVSSENFKKVCGTLARYIREGCRGNGGRADKMRDFVARNGAFCQAIENADKLVAKYDKLSKRKRHTLNLYYLSIAHTINSLAYKKASGFVSATTKGAVADDFTGDVCIYGWVPKETGFNRTIDYVISENTEAVKNMGMPYCDTPVYPEQKEISLRCGFLPHFIIGFKVRNNFYVNPAVFTSIDKMREKRTFKKLSQYRSDLLRYGLNVDQTNFEEFCRMTHFKRFYTFDGVKYEIHSLW